MKSQEEKKRKHLHNKNAKIKNTGWPVGNLKMRKYPFMLCGIIHLTQRCWLNMEQNSLHVFTPVRDSGLGCFCYGLCILLCLLMRLMAVFFGLVDGLEG